MATGDANDMAARMQAVLPGGWFPAVTTVLSAVLQGIGAGFAAFYQQIVFVISICRIGTSTGYWLDLTGADFFGTTLPRHTGESDAAYLARIDAALFAPHGTRAAVIGAAQAACGGPVAVVEFNRLADCGALDMGTLALDTAGCLGTYLLPWQCLVTAPRVNGATVAQVQTAVNNARPVNSIPWLNT